MERANFADRLRWGVEMARPGGSGGAAATQSTLIFPIPIIESARIGAARALDRRWRSLQQRRRLVALGRPGRRGPVTETVGALGQEIALVFGAAAIGASALRHVPGLTVRSPGLRHSLVHIGTRPGGGRPNPYRHRTTALSYELIPGGDVHLGTNGGNLNRTRPRVGILTLTQSGNYGTALQAYSTLRIFQASTDEVEFRVVRTDIKKLRQRRLLRKISPRGQSVGITHTKNYIAVQKFVKEDVVGDVPYVDISDRESAFTYLNAEFDAFISGSDEIWNLAEIGTKSLYFIPPSLGKYRASFATSANRLDTNKLSADQLEVVRDSLSGYDYISVRDTNTKNFVLQNLGSSVKPVEIIDPTLIYDFPELAQSKNSRDASTVPNRRRILLMITSPRIAEAVISRYAGNADIDTVFVRH